MTICAKCGKRYGIWVDKGLGKAFKETTWDYKSDVIEGECVECDHEHRRI